MLVVCVHVVLCRCVLCGCVLCWCWRWCLVVVVLCVVYMLCVVWVVCVFVFLCCFTFFSQFSSLSFLLSLFPSSLFSLLSSLPLPLLSSLLATKHCGKNRSTNTAANFEAFECDLAHGRCTAVGSLPPPLSLPPPFSPSPPQKKKKKRELFITGIFPARNLFLLQFKINSKKNAAG